MVAIYIDVCMCITNFTFVNFSLYQVYTWGKGDLLHHNTHYYNKNRHIHWSKLP